MITDLALFFLTTQRKQEETGFILSLATRWRFQCKTCRFNQSYAVHNLARTSKSAKNYCLTRSHLRIACRIIKENLIGAMTIGRISVVNYLVEIIFVRLRRLSSIDERANASNGCSSAFNVTS